jgi:molybdopterin/thiamine biosynthesis adenylyltransferase
VNQAKLAELRIAIVGTGSIGSYTAQALTKMGVGHFQLWDNDLVELHNLSNQFFTKDSLEIPKVVAAEKECQRIAPSNVDIDIRNEFYSGQDLDFDVVIALTDNIEGRKASFEAAKRSERCKLFIDGRMGAELFRGFAFNPHSAADADKYYKDYIDGVSNEELPCTARTIIYNVLLASSAIASFVKKFVQGETMPFMLIFNFGDYSFAKSNSQAGAS